MSQIEHEWRFLFGSKCITSTKGWVSKREFRDGNCRGDSNLASFGQFRNLLHFKPFFRVKYIEVVRPLYWIECVSKGKKGHLPLLWHPSRPLRLAGRHFHISLHPFAQPVCFTIARNNLLWPLTLFSPRFIPRTKVKMQFWRLPEFGSI